MKINYEIFDKWWEYFLVAWWSVSSPEGDILLGRTNVTTEDIQKRYKSDVKSLIDGKDEKNIDRFVSFVNKRCEEEDGRKQTIEAKAHSLIGQTGIAVSLLIGTLSLGTTQFKDWHLILKLFTWLVFLVIVINFVIAGLHARNVVTLKAGYAHQDFNSFLGSDIGLVDLVLILEKIKISQYNSYLNDIKGTYLRFAHWYYKFSFLLIVFGALILPSTIIFVNTFSSNDKNTEAKQMIIPNSSINDNSRESIINQYFINHDSLDIKVEK